MNVRVSYNGIPITGTALRKEFNYLSAPKAKVERLVGKGEWIRLRRNLYMPVNVNTFNNFLAANYMVSPSYVSGLTALSFHGIIPETVLDTISMTTAKPVTYNNPLGTFTYHHCSPEYFYVGICPTEILGNTVLLAGTEKALCDYIITTPNLNLRYMKETKVWLEEEMRMDMEELSAMDLSIIKQCSLVGKKQTMLSNIIKIFS